MDKDINGREYVRISSYVGSDFKNGRCQFCGGRRTKVLRTKLVVDDEGCYWWERLRGCCTYACPGKYGVTQERLT